MSEPVRVYLRVPGTQPMPDLMRLIQGIEAAGFDQDSGFGIVMAFQAVASVPPPPAPAAPVITHPHFTGTGTRQLQDNSRRAIEALFAKSFD